MNVLELWKNRTHTELRDQLAKALAECDELREQMEERDKETAYLISQKMRTIELKDCDIAVRDKVITEAFSILDSTIARLKTRAKVFSHDHDDAA